MGCSRSWGVLAASGFRHIALSCLLTGSVACGSYTSNTDGGRTESSSTEGTSTKGTSTKGTSTEGASTEGTSTKSTSTEGSSAGGSAWGSSAAGSITGGTQADDACDCESRDCRPAPEVASDLCRRGDLVTYTEREGCDYVELSYDFNRGWEGYYYDEQGTLVAFGLDNAFGGSLYCGVATSCTGDIIQHCRICRASWYPEDTVPDCPTTLWGTGGGDDP